MTAPLSLPQWLDYRCLAVGIGLLFAPLAWAVVFLSGQSFGPLLLVGLPVAGIAALICKPVQGLWGDVAIATLLVVQAILLTAHFEGHPWQADTHMIFFALMAIIATLGRVSVLILACALTSVYLVAGAAFWPALLWPSTTGSATVMRSLLHVLLLLLEGGVLAVAMVQRQHAREEIRQAAVRLETKSQMAIDAHLETEAAHQTGQEVIDKVRVALTKLSGRDMTCSIAPPFPEAYEFMRQDFNDTVETLRDAFLSARDFANTVTVEAQSLAHDITGAASQSDQQAEHLRQMTAAAAHLLEIFGTTATQAAEAAAAAGQARSSAERIETVTTQAVSAMRGIEGSSHEISQIVDLIDDVAFQTNLLALNAGVEAARAGPSGKGFAVVATEVRHLAHSTTDAAAGIRKLIRNSVDQVSTGAKLVDAVGQSVQEILEHVTQTSDLASNISAQNAKQAVDLQGLHGKISEADSQAETTAGNSRQLAARSRKMTLGSKKLSCDIEAFTFTEADLINGISQEHAAGSGR